MHGYYFLGAYLPILVAVLLGIWWKCIYGRLKEMELFYQIGKSGELCAPALVVFPGVCKRGSRDAMYAVGLRNATPRKRRTDM